jgi:tRNA pseudouridine55 synthase
MARRKRGTPVHGWIALDKPEDLTSTDAVARIRRLFNAEKAGHAGTLDPLASGLLPIALGEATKTVPFLMEAEKTYRFDVTWGASTTTQDREGEITARSEVRPTEEAIADALLAFRGEIDQVPPQFSAVKINGERAYDLAREGEVVDIPARRVVVHEVRHLTSGSPDVCALEVRTGKGFYVRAMARDLATALGAEGHVSYLRRNAVGAFSEKNAVPLSKLMEIGDRADLAEFLLPVETALDDIPALAITEGDLADLQQGRAIVLLPHIVEQWRAQRRPRTISGEDASRAAYVVCRGEAVALGEVRAGRFQPTRVFQLG